MESTKRCTQYSQRRANEGRIRCRGGLRRSAVRAGVGERPEPQGKPFWSTISVHASTVNHHDVWSLQGVGLSADATPMILGTDAAGVLEEDIPVAKGSKPEAKWVLYTFIGDRRRRGRCQGSDAPSVRKIRGTMRADAGTQRERVRQTVQPEP